MTQQQRKKEHEQNKRDGTDYNNIDKNANSIRKDSNRNRKDGKEMIDIQIVLISLLYPLMIPIYYKIGKIEGELKRMNGKK